MEPVGERLRQARKAKGLSLGEVASTTKISVAALTALERGDVTRLPGGIFGRSFVKAYALTVDLDPAEIVPDFEAEVVEAERDSARKLKQAPITDDDRQFAERQRRAMVLFQRVGIGLLILLAAAVIWGIWAWQSRDDVPPQALSVERPAQPPATPTPVALPPAPARAAAEQTSRLTIEFEVGAACWVKVTADGLVVHEQELSAGSRRSFSAERELVFDVGNAGVVTWTINGREANPIGAVGAHRVVRVTPDNVDTFISQN